MSFTMLPFPENHIQQSVVLLNISHKPLFLLTIIFSYSTLYVKYKHNVELWRSKMGKLFMTEQDIKTLMTLAKKQPRDHLLFRLMACTGLRVSDLVRLRRDQMVEKNGHIITVLRVKMKKTDKWIERALREDTREALLQYMGARHDTLPWLFISQSRRTKFHTPGPLTRSAAHLIVKKYLKMLYPESLIQGTSTHVLRRSIAKIINRKTGRIETAQEWLGHTSTAHTRIYIDAEDYRDKANGVVAALDI
jgi:integrase